MATQEDIDNAQNALIVELQAQINALKGAVDEGGLEVIPEDKLVDCPTCNTTQKCETCGNPIPSNPASPNKWLKPGKMLTTSERSD